MAAEKKKAEKVAEAAAEVEEKAAEAAEAAAEELSERVADDRRRIDEMIHSLQELGNVARRAGESLRSNLSNAPDAVRDGIAQTEEKVRERPLAALGMAAGVGLVLGLLLNRRH